MHSGSRAVEGQKSAGKKTAAQTSISGPAIPESTCTGEVAGLWNPWNPGKEHASVIRRAAGSKEEGAEAQRKGGRVDGARVHTRPSLFFFFGLPSPLAPAPHPRKPHLPLAPRTPPRSERSPAFQPLAGWVAGAPTPAADLGCPMGKASILSLRCSVSDLSLTHRRDQQTQL